MTGRLESGSAVDFGVERDEREARLPVLGHARAPAREAFERALDARPLVAPQLFVLARAREHALDFGKDEFVSTFLIHRLAAREPSRERRSDAFYERVIAALNRDARAHGPRARELREVAGLRRGDESVS